jgi:hypothetical protein
VEELSCNWQTQINSSPYARPHWMLLPCEQLCPEQHLSVAAQSSTWYVHQIRTENETPPGASSLQAPHTCVLFKDSLSAQCTLLLFLAPHRDTHVNMLNLTMECFVEKFRLWNTYLILWKFNVKIHTYFPPPPPPENMTAKHIPNFVANLNSFTSTTNQDDKTILTII